MIKTNSIDLLAINKYILKYRYQLLILFTLISTNANAEVIGTLNASTNYIWRGVSQTTDNPAISGSIEYRTKHNSYLGLWTSNTKYGGRHGQEINAYLGHKFDFDQVTVDIALRHYYFPNGGKYNYDFRPDKWDDKESSSFDEFQTNIEFSGLGFGYAYSNNYLDSGYVGHYAEFNYTYKFENELFIKIHAGEQMSKAIDDTQYRVGDRSLTLKYKYIYCTASTMTDNVDGRQSDKIRYTLGLSITIGEK